MAGWLGLFVFPSFTECSNFICFRLGRTSASRLELQILRALVLAKMLYAIHWINFFIFCFCFLLSPRLEMFCFSFPTELLFYVFGKELIRQTKSRDTSWLKIWIFLFFFFFRRATKPFLRRKKRRLELEHFMEMFFLDWISWISDFEPKEKGFASTSHCEEPIGLPRSPVFSKWVWLMWKLLFDWCDRVRLDLSEEAVRLGYLDNR